MTEKSGFLCNHPSVYLSAQLSRSWACSSCQRLHWALLSPALGRVILKQPFSLKLRGT